MLDKKILCHLDPETVVAIGASVYAETLNSSKIELKDNHMKKHKINKCSIGIEIVDGIMYKIIQKNQQIPCEITTLLTTCEDEQKKCLIKIYKGENFFVKDNKIIGKFWVKQLPDRPRSYLKIQITFQLTENGTLYLLVYEKISGLKQKFRVDSGKDDYIDLKFNYEKDIMKTQYQRFRDLTEQEFYLRKRKRMLLENVLHQAKNELGIYVPEVLIKIKDVFVWLKSDEDLNSNKLTQKLIEFQVIKKKEFYKYIFKNSIIIITKLFIRAL